MLTFYINYVNFCINNIYTMKNNYERLSITIVSIIVFTTSNYEYKPHDHLYLKLNIFYIFKMENSMVP